MTPAAFLQALIDARHLSGNALAAALVRDGLTVTNLQSQISKFLSGKVTEPRIDTREPIARFFGFSKEALVDEGIATAEAIRLKLIPGPERADRHLSSNVHVLSQEINAVPLISWVRAGNWSSTPDPFLPGGADEWLPCPVRHGPHTIALRVDGDSMFNPGGKPSYADGDIIFVDPDRDVKPGDRCVVRLEDQDHATFKQLVVEDGRRLLKALNPDWKPRYIEIDANAQMVGLVIGKWVPE